jgi:hypothetical protein
MEKGLEYMTDCTQSASTELTESMPSKLIFTISRIALPNGVSAQAWCGEQSGDFFQENYADLGTQVGTTKAE